MKTVWIKNGLAKYQGAEFGEGIVDYQINKLSSLKIWDFLAIAA